MTDEGMPPSHQPRSDPVLPGTEQVAASTGLRKVFGAFPSGVAAVCARCDGEPVGMAVSTFTPVSLDPPLISLCIQRTSTTWPRLRRAPVLGVSVLGADHEHAGRQLSLKTGDRFAGVDTVTVGSGAIHLRRSCAWFDCTLDAELPAGDHVIAVLRIVRSGVSERTAPLVFHASRFRRLADMPDPTSALERVHMLPAAATVPAALEEIRRGRPVVVLDDADRQNEGDLIFAAELATTELLSFVVRHTSGFVCVALPPAECRRLRLDPMPVDNHNRFGTAYRVTVDLTGTGTGISATARARTIAALARAEHGPADFTRPGHVVPLQARDGGVLQRAGHTEAAVDLARLAGLRPAGGLCEIVSTRDPVAMASGEELYEFAAEHGLLTVTIADLIAYRLETERPVDRGPDIALPAGRRG